MRGRAWIQNQTAEDWFLTLVVAAASVAMIRTTVSVGMDFEVYWRAARFLLHGEGIYDLSRDGPMVFKYPPWWAALFVPWGVLPLGLAKFAWGLLEAVSLLVVVARVRVLGVRPLIAGLVTLGFAGLWTVHAFVGQITLPLLMLGMLMNPWKGGGWSVSRFALLVWAFSAKVFTLFPLVPWGARLIRGGRVGRALLAVALLLGVLSLPVLSVTEGHSVPGMFGDFWRAASSGGSRQGTRQVETITREVQSFPVLIMRAAGWSGEQAVHYSLIAAIVSLLAAAAWHRRSQALPSDERWAGWLALTAVVQPLGWFHVFLLALPATALAWERGVASRDRWVTAAAVGGGLMVAAMTRKTLGPVGAVLEDGSVKSWGVVLVLWALSRGPAST